MIRFSISGEGPRYWHSTADLMVNGKRIRIWQLFRKRYPYSSKPHSGFVIFNVKSYFLFAIDRNSKRTDLILFGHYFTFKHK